MRPRRLHARPAGATTAAGNHLVMQAEPFPLAENDPASPVLPRLLASADPAAAAERGLGVHQLREGMSMRWRRGALGHDELDTTGTHDVSACFVFALWDDGQPAAVENGGLFGTVGWMALTSPHGLGALAAHSAGASFHLIVELSEAVRTELFQGDSETARRGFEAMTRADATPALRALTPAARLAVESVRRCPLAGACRALVLGARCHDLLVEFISASDEAAARPAPMMSDTESRVRAAAAALSRRLDLTPSLEALAREAGLSESTLKRGFRQVFGTTVFDHLRALRMERAKQLLQSGDATVIEAATLVGYSNPSNFAAAFRRQFGLNPKEFQLAARR